jgi:hypothetical protein
VHSEIVPECRDSIRRTELLEFSTHSDEYRPMVPTNQDTPGLRPLSLNDNLLDPRRLILEIQDWAHQMPAGTGVVVVDNLESLLNGVSVEDRPITMAEVFRALRDEAEARSLVVIVVSQQSHALAACSPAKSEIPIIVSMSHTVLNLRRLERIEASDLPAHRHVAMDITRVEKTITTNLVFIGELRRFRDSFTS